MRFANEDSHQGGAWSEWEHYSATKLWSLKPGEGIRRVWLQLQDEYGNMSGFIALNQVTVDLTNPTLPANPGLLGVTGNVPTWQWDPSTDDYLQGYEVRVGTKSGLGDVVPGTGEVNARSVGLVTSWVQDVEAPSRGEYYLQVRAVDLAGNASPWVAAGPFTVTWPADYSCTYDDIGNRETQDRFGTSSTYTYNDAGQLTRTTQGTETEDFEYDLAGNTVKRTKGDLVWEYEYDEENRLVTVSRTKGTEPQAWVAKYVYDPDGMRVRSVFSGTPEHPGGWTVVHLNQGTDTIYEASGIVILTS